MDGLGKLMAPPPGRSQVLSLWGDSAVGSQGW